MKTKPQPIAPAPALVLVADEPKPSCCIDSCTNIAQWKGLCSRCYGEAKHVINSGQTSWQELFDLGLAINDAPFAIAFKRAKEGVK